jgi:hypothetical protein
MSDDAGDELRSLAEKLYALKPRVSLWLLFHEREELSGTLGHPCL